MKERRATYREQDDLEAIQVSLALPGHDYVRVALINLSARGATVVATALDEADGYVIGATVYVEFQLANHEPVAEIGAVIRNVRGSGGTRIFGLEVLDWAEIHTKLPPRLFAKFNRRRHVRVDIPVATPVDVVVARSNDRDPIRAALADVSVSGCRLVCPEGAVFAPGEQVGLTFTLPVSAHPLALSGVVRNVTGAAEGARCGIEFEGLDSREERELSKYVIERERDAVV